MKLHPKYVWEEFYYTQRLVPSAVSGIWGLGVYPPQIKGTKAHLLFLPTKDFFQSWLSGCHKHLINTSNAPPG
jgi:hypothetical protein